MSNPVTESQVPIIKNVISEIKTEYGEQLSNLRRQLDDLEDKILGKLGNALNNLSSEYAETHLRDEDEEEVTEIVTDFISANFENLEWDGNCDWDNYDIGSPVSFWIPSTC